MPAVIVKVSKTEDLYLRWCTITDSWTHIGTRKQMREILRGIGDDGSGERFARVDHAGTSAMWPRDQDPAYGWGDGAIVYRQDGVLQRKDLREAVGRWIEHGEDADIADLLEPFEP